LYWLEIVSLFFNILWAIVIGAGVALFIGMMISYETSLEKKHILSSLTILGASLVVLDLLGMSYGLYREKVLNYGAKIYWFTPLQPILAISGAALIIISSLKFIRDTKDKIVIFTSINYFEAKEMKK